MNQDTLEFLLMKQEKYGVKIKGDTMMMGITNVRKRIEKNNRVFFF